MGAQPTGGFNPRYLVYRFFTFFIPITTLLFSPIQASSLNLLLQPAPRAIQQEVQEKLEKLHRKSATQIGKKLVKGGFKKLLPRLGGIVALYGGYVDYSDRHGHIAFPLLHKAPHISLVITPSVSLVTVYANTISHKKLVAQVPTVTYLFHKKVNGDKTTYWEVSQKESPKDGAISPLSVVLLTKPKNIVVPTGDFMTTEHSNMVLPPLYIVGSASNVKAVINFLDMRRFFEPIARKEKAIKKKSIQKIIQNN